MTSPLRQALKLKALANLVGTDEQTENVTTLRQNLECVKLLVDLYIEVCN
jgi:hypothetical protein